MYTYIKSFAIQKGYLPTIREICIGVGLKSTSSVQQRMIRLEDLGYIEWVKDDNAKIGHTSRYIVKGLRYVEDRAD